MKKIFNILLAAAAMLYFAPFVNAQDQDYSINGQIKDQKTGATLSFPKLKPVVIEEENKIACSKNVSSPFSDGTYWIKLETFATGSASQSVGSTPSDIVLILDSSTSMQHQDYGADDGEYKALPVYNFTYNTFSNPNGYNEPFYGGVSNNVTNLYYKYNDEYYQISRGGNQNNTARYLSFNVGSTTYYLNNNVNGGQPSTSAPSRSNGPTGNDGVVWTGVLYTTGKMARIDALKNAVNEFIDNIYQNDAEVTAIDSHFDGNRIAIVTYDANAYKLTSNYSWQTADNQRANWFDIGTAGVRDNLKNAILSMGLHNYTRPELGMREAIDDLLDGTPSTKRSNANLTVVVFTDGVPAQQSTGGNGNNFDSGIANNAVNYGYQIKNTYEANLFTIGLLDKNSDDEHVKRGIQFLDLLSSNYPNSSIENGGTWTVSGNTVTVPGLTGGSKDPDGEYFQLVDENTDLSSIFDAISKQSGGTANPSLSAATSTVDIVSNSFILPDGIDAENVKDYIKVFTAKLNRIENGKYYFDTEILIPHSPDKYNVYNSAGELESQVDVDDAIVVSLEGTNGIKVTNFDYSKNFCGPVYKDDGTTFDHWQGHEVIIMIPIKMNPEAVGGPNVETNVEGSGIYIDPESDPIISFESPTVSLPVNVHLTKTGLSLGESAKFKIERAVLLETEVDQDENGVPDRLEANTAASEALWQYVSTVFVTKTSTDDPLVKVKGMPATTEGEGEDQAGFIYRITEEEWSWSYSRDTEPQYTKTSKVDNPFTFNNTKKPNIDYIIRNAESKVTNVFKTGDFNPKYNDSKNNGRTQYNPTSTQSGSGTGSSGNQ